MANKPLTEKQRDYLKPALDNLDVAFNELQDQLRRLPPDGDPREPTGCMRCDCPRFQGKSPQSCSNPRCGHSFVSHTFI